MYFRDFRRHFRFTEHVAALSRFINEFVQEREVKLRVSNAMSHYFDALAKQTLETIRDEVALSFEAVSYACARFEVEVEFYSNVEDRDAETRRIAQQLLDIDFVSRDHILERRLVDIAKYESEEIADNEDSIMSTISDVYSHIDRVMTEELVSAVRHTLENRLVNVADMTVEMSNLANMIREQLY